MTCLVHNRDPKSGTVYVYESRSYRDPVTHKPRAHRHCIGKLDEAGNIVPTGKRGRQKKDQGADDNTDYKSMYLRQEKRIEDRDKTIVQLRDCIAELKIENQALIRTLDKIGSLVSSQRKH